MASPRPPRPEADTFTPRLGAEAAERNRLARSFDHRRSAWRAGDVGRSVGTFAAVLGRSPWIRRSARTDVIPTSDTDDLDVRPPARFWPFEHDDQPDGDDLGQRSTDAAPRGSVGVPASRPRRQRVDKMNVLRDVLSAGAAPEGWEDVLAAFLPPPEERVEPERPQIVHRALVRAADAPPRGLALVVRRKRTWAGSGTAPGSTSTTTAPSSTGAVADDRIDGSTDRSRGVAREQRPASSAARGGEGDAPGPRPTPLTASGVAAADAVDDVRTSSVLRRAAAELAPRPAHDVAVRRADARPAAARGGDEPRATATLAERSPTPARIATVDADAVGDVLRAVALRRSPQRRATATAGSGQSSPRPTGAGRTSAPAAVRGTSVDADGPRPVAPTVAPGPTSAPTPTGMGGGGARRSARATVAAPRQPTLTDTPHAADSGEAAAEGLIGRAVDPAPARGGPQDPDVATSANEVLRPLRRSVLAHQRALDPGVTATGASAGSPIVTTSMLAPSALWTGSGPERGPAVEVHAVRDAAVRPAPRTLADASFDADGDVADGAPVGEAAAARPRARTSIRRAGRVVSSAPRATVTDATPTSTPMSAATSQDQPTGRAGVVRRSALVRPATAVDADVTRSVARVRRGAASEPGADRPATPASTDADATGGPTAATVSRPAHLADRAPVRRRPMPIRFAIRAAGPSSLSTVDAPGDATSDRLRVRVDGLGRLLRRVAPRQRWLEADEDLATTSAGTGRDRTPVANATADAATAADRAVRTRRIESTVRRAPGVARRGAGTPGTAEAASRRGVQQVAVARSRSLGASAAAALARLSGTNWMRPADHASERTSRRTVDPTVDPTIDRATALGLGAPRVRQAVVRRRPLVGEPAASAVARTMPRASARTLGFGTRSLGGHDHLAGSDEVTSTGAASRLGERSNDVRAPGADRSLPRGASGAPGQRGIDRPPSDPAQMGELAVRPAAANAGSGQAPAPDDTAGDRSGLGRGDRSGTSDGHPPRTRTGRPGEAPRLRRRARRATPPPWRPGAQSIQYGDPGRAGAPDEGRPVRRSSIPIAHRRLGRRPRPATPGVGVTDATNAGPWDQLAGAPVRPAGPTGRDPSSIDSVPGGTRSDEMPTAPDRVHGVRRLGTPHPGSARRSTTRTTRALRRLGPAGRDAPGRRPVLQRSTVDGPHGDDVALPVRPPSGDALAERFLDELSRHQPARPAPLPVAFRPLAEVIAGDRVARISTDVASRRALDAVGMRAATTDDVIHLAVAPHELRAPSKELAGVVAHELTHVAHASAAPRFYGDHRDSAEERQAHEIGEIIRRTPLAPRLAVVPARGSDTVSSDRGSTVQRSTSPGTLNAADVAARLSGSAPDTTVRRAVTMGSHRRGSASSSPPPSSDSDAPPQSSSSAPTSSASTSSDTTPSSSTPAVVSPENFELYLRQNFDVIMELIEERVMSQIDRRGGRYRGDI